MNRPPDCIITIFGASGDLTHRKLVPALFMLYRQNLMPRSFAVIGASRTDLTDEKFRELIRSSVRSAFSDTDDVKLKSFIDNFYYLVLNTADKDDYGKLETKLCEVDEIKKTNGNYIFYLATPPNTYLTIAHGIQKYNLQKQISGIKRIIIEKPFGYDLESARNLNKELLNIFEEQQIYRIDHYLGKETVQNILVLRFANGIFEPLWNRNYIDHVEITAAESIGVEQRGSYYEGAGALRDMVQNHLLQVTGFIAMEPPSSFEPNAVRNETLKVFQSFRKIQEEEIEKVAVRGQYIDSIIKGEKITGYRQEKDVAPDSRIETYAALKIYIDNWRWGGVPFYIRAGKRLPTRVTEAVIHFNKTPHHLFSEYNIEQTSNMMIIRIQPDEGILLKFGLKTPGAGYRIKTVNMDFHYSDISSTELPGAYERLLLDCMNNDSTLFTRSDAVEECWSFVDPVLKGWHNNHNIKIYGYPAGTWGPPEANNLFDDTKSEWRYPCKNLTDDGYYCEL